jgi:hypothetical protein
MDLWKALGALKRNDIEGAVELVREYEKSGKKVPPDAAHTLYMLQDEPEELRKALIKYRREKTT